MQQWYAVHTQPGAERKAAFNLERQGFTIYLPQYIKRRCHARKVDWVATPLFPRYLFVGLDLERDRWRAVQSTFGVSHMVFQGDWPAPVPPQIIDAIQAREDSDGMVLMDRPASFRKGESVRMVDGPLAETEGLFEGYTDRERVIVLLDLLGRRVRVRTSLHTVSACA